MDEYTPVYCVSCAQLQFNDWRGKPCQFCGALEFAPVRPAPTFTGIDAKYLRTLDIPSDDVKRKPKR